MGPDLECHDVRTGNGDGCPAAVNWAPRAARRRAVSHGASLQLLPAEAERRAFQWGRKICGVPGYVDETNGMVTATPSGLKAGGAVPPAPSTRPSGWLFRWHRIPDQHPRCSLRWLHGRGLYGATRLGRCLGKSERRTLNSGIAVWQ